MVPDCRLRELKEISSCPVLESILTAISFKNSTFLVLSRKTSSAIYPCHTGQSSAGNPAGVYKRLSFLSGRCSVPAGEREKSCISKGSSIRDVKEHWSVAPSRIFSSVSPLLITFLSLWEPASGAKKRFL